MLVVHATCSTVDKVRTLICVRTSGNFRPSVMKNLLTTTTSATVYSPSSRVMIVAVNGSESLHVLPVCVWKRREVYLWRSIFIWSRIYSRSLINYNEGFHSVG